MKTGGQAVTLARLQVLDGTPEDKARVAAWDWLSAMLNVLDSKTSALLRFNAIVVAALAYLVVVSGIDQFAQAKPLIRTLGFAVGHISLVLSVASCGCVFAGPGVDDGVLARFSELMAHRTRLYAWGLVARGRGRIGLCSAGCVGDHSLKRECSWPT